MGALKGQPKTTHLKKTRSDTFFYIEKHHLVHEEERLMQRTLKYFGLAAGLILAMGAVGCSDDDSGDPCGNGVIDSTLGEQCDTDDLGGASCESLGHGGGALPCSDQCTFDESGCTDDCGNGVVDAGEDCDGSNLGGATCESEGQDPGTLACTSDCTFDTSGCGEQSVCGNGTIEGTEECDLFELNGQTCSSLGFEGGDLSCTVGCTFNTVDCYAAAVMDVGSACLEDSDCNGGICLSEVAPDRHWGQAGGYCYEPCDQNDNCPLSGAIGVCVPFTSSKLCMRGCDLANPDCRPGQACEDIGGGVGVCFWARCTADSECTITNDCDTDSNSENFGWCISPLEDCSNGTDDDFDGRVDCADPECIGETNCPIGEICGNGVDDDGDSAVDCDDGECIDLGICTGQICTAPTGADLTCGDTLTGESNTQAGSTDVIEGAECVDPSTGNAGAYFSNEWGPEYSYRLTVTQPQQVTVTVDNYSGDLDVYIVKEVLGGCDPRRGCFQWGGNGVGVPEVMTFTAYPNMVYYVVVDGFEGNESTYDISVECAGTGYEDCGDGTDNDGDGIVDCDDPDCWGVGACSTEVDCGNSEDDDLDGAVDCADSDCSSDVNCQAGTGYWELWERDGASGEFDMVGQALTFTADTSAQGYTFASAAQGDWLYAPGTGSASTMTISLNNNDVGELVGLPFAFPFDGTTHNFVYVIDNGYVSFINEGGWMPGPNGWNVYQFPRIGPLWTDLDPATGTITFDSFGTYVVITWDGLPLDSASASTPNQFQLVLHQNGDIQMYWKAVDAVANQPTNTEGMVTLVGAEIGLPPPESNFQ